MLELEPKFMSLMDSCGVSAGLELSGDTTPCKVTPVILHGVASSSYTRLYSQRSLEAT